MRCLSIALLITSPSHVARLSFSHGCFSSLVSSSCDRSRGWALVLRINLLNGDLVVIQKALIFLFVATLLGIVWIKL